MTRDDHERLADRIGNHTLLTPDQNKLRGNHGFDEAKKVYREASFILTQELADHKGDWNEEAIQARQEVMAKAAVSIWKLRPDKPAKSIKAKVSGKRGS
jgi:hypothetical protein